ncbi:NrfD/PsrC family molybdoenzyme membrane anchor subunit [Azospirillum sp. ST 5-10]|uniref:NrfD/PsrC family molybdoenzyme membrane anchor subunit n=1 Tax=unclassified Azospirillum TaxID=2630922 RepID=UPI003F4A541E
MSESGLQPHGFTARAYRSTKAAGALAHEFAVFPLDARSRRRWWLLLAAGLLLTAAGAVSTAVLLRDGLGIWGINNTVAWGIAIVSTIWWIGIAHAATLLSAVLLLIGKEWRTSLNRYGEAMALYAALCAAIFPILHLGRPGYFYWMFPYASTTGVWPQFRSPLEWDVFSYLFYLVYVFVFGYVGMIPDLAILRGRARTRLRALIYGVAALGWRGSAGQWAVWRAIYRSLAALAIPAVFVHTGGAYLFASSPLPGWHSTILPAYVMFGALFSGFALLAIITVVLREAFDLHDYLSRVHLDYLGRAILLFGALMLYAHAFKEFHAAYGAGAGLDALVERATGPYAVLYWGALAVNVGAVALLVRPGVRCSPVALLAVSAAVVAGMWVDRYVLLVTGLSRGFLPARWETYSPTVWDWTLLAGTGGLFLVLFLLFVRVLPLLSITDVKESLHEGRDG